jgi:3',5'-cyclic AMP phosphodiesterase CpdA
MRSRHEVKVLLTAVMLWVLCGLAGIRPGAAQEVERVKPIAPPAAPLPSEEQSRGVTRFSFILYGDTRGRHDGVSLQYEHSMVVDGILAQIKKLRNTDSPVRFVLQTGDAVVRGQEAQKWNVSFVPVIDRLTAQGGVPYFMIPGNHDVSSATTADAPQRQVGLRNFLDAVQALIPPDGSPRRLAGYPTYSFGYGNTFVVGFDSDIVNDDKQYLWVKGQLEGLDRQRYVNIFVFCHHPPFSSGPHSVHSDEVVNVLRSRYLPLFQAHNVRAMLSGHEHLYEHWVEYYTDNRGTHRMDFLVSGGGGAPLYSYHGEPNLDDFLKANKGMQVRLQHLVKPGPEGALSPYHYVVIHVDGEQINLEVFGVDWGTGFHPYQSNQAGLQDSPIR